MLEFRTAPGDRGRLVHGILARQPRRKPRDDRISRLAFGDDPRSKTTPEIRSALVLWSKEYVAKERPCSVRGRLALTHCSRGICATRHQLLEIRQPTA